MPRPTLVFNSDPTAFAISINENRNLGPFQSAHQCIHPIHLSGMAMDLSLCDVRHRFPFGTIRKPVSSRALRILHPGSHFHISVNHEPSRRLRIWPSSSNHLHRRVQRFLSVFGILPAIHVLGYCGQSLHRHRISVVPL